jgi:multiple sugar transport system ATP-binding protein
MTGISCEAITKVYGDGTKAVDALDLEVTEGQLMVLVGPSGCGKTTLLRMIAGLEDITDGVIRIGGKPVNDVPAKDRDIAMVFQSYALYPHMTVFDNIAFGLKLHKTPKKEIEQRVTETARVIGLGDLLQKKPRQLSGGQRQRVAMGRAIARKPQVFLLDEPLSNLDAKLRFQMRSEIGRIQRNLGVTSVYVTHDQTEAMTLGDRVAVLRTGQLQQVDTPQVLYRRPSNLFVAGFIGSPAMNLVGAYVRRGADGYFVEFGGIRLRIGEAALLLRPALARYENQAVVVGIRPEHLQDASFVSDTPVDRRFKAVIDLREEMGAETYLYFVVDTPPVLTEDIRQLAADVDVGALTDLESQATTQTTRFVARVDPRTHVPEGGEVELAVNTEELHFFDPVTSVSIYGDAKPRLERLTVSRASLAAS